MSQVMKTKECDDFMVQHYVSNMQREKKTKYRQRDITH